MAWKNPHKIPPSKGSGVFLTKEMIQIEKQDRIDDRDDISLGKRLMKSRFDKALKDKRKHRLFVVLTCNSCNFRASYSIPEGTNFGGCRCIKCLKLGTLYQKLR